MYYEEKQVGLDWFYKSTPMGPYIEFSTKQYQRKIVELQEEINVLRDELKHVC